MEYFTKETNQSMANRFPYQHNHLYVVVYDMVKSSNNEPVHKKDINGNTIMKMRFFLIEQEKDKQPVLVDFTRTIAFLCDKKLDWQYRMFNQGKLYQLETYLNDKLKEVNGKTVSLSLM